MWLNRLSVIPRQGETGTRVEEICRQMGISDATYYNWKKKYGGLGPSEVRKLKQLEEENKKLKQMVADLSLDKQMLQDVLKKRPEGEAEAGSRGPFMRFLPGWCSSKLPGCWNQPFNVLLQIS